MWLFLYLIIFHIWHHKVFSVLWSTSIMLASCVTNIADGECTSHMNSINFVRFVFPDSNPTGNPKSGGTHSWWNEGKLVFFIPFPHHRHIHVIAEHCVSRKPDKTFHWTQDVWGLMYVPSSSNPASFPSYLLSDRHFLTTVGLEGSGDGRGSKYSKLFGKAINGWHIMTVHARGADTCVTKAIRSLIG